MTSWRHWAAALALLPLAVQAKPTAEYFPKAQLSEQLPTPEAVLGFGIGDWHLRHDQQLAYLEQLAARSERIRLIDIGRTTEQRRQVVLAISSPANLARLEQIRRQHLRVLDGERDDSLPALAWLGYSIHGDEPSGANAAPLVAYWLAAGQDAEVKAILEQTVVLIDPALNPDGLDRYANFANNHQGRHNSGSLQHRTRWQDFPAGRLSHYGFDLNRDWLLLTHPASRNRIAFWQRWLPQVFGDFHEMGPHSSFFFQPGIPSRVNPLTPPRNQELTRKLAEGVAQALDGQGRLYFTGESYDDFYWGKGSSYADGLGAIGILYEQARARGQKVETPFGELTFTYGIENQLTASQNLLRGVLAHRAELREYQAGFFASAREEGRDEKLKGYLLKNPDDPARLEELAALLAAHGIQIYELGRDVDLEGRRFKAGSDLYIPLAQPQYRLLRSIFERRTSFQDNSFYDVSSWNLPLAFNVEAIGVSDGRYKSHMEARPWQPQGRRDIAVEPAYAWAFQWRASQAPALLADLLAQGVRVFASGREMVNSGHRLSPGDMLIPAGIQDQPELLKLLTRLANKHQLPLMALKGGLSAKGGDVGSPSLVPMTKPRVALLVGRDIHAQRAGGVWEALDQRAGVELTLLESTLLPWMDINEFSHLILPSASWLGLGEDFTGRLKGWVERGGTLITLTDASTWAASQGLLKAEVLAEEDRALLFPTKDLSYADRDAHGANMLIAGAQVLADLDPGHPLNWGLGSLTLPLMRDHTGMLVKSEGDFTVLGRYAEQPLLSGFMAGANKDQLAGTPAAVAQRLGKGAVVAFMDDVSFRGIQRGSERWLSNALYFTPNF
ncbi:M14 family zinc carboxypeptidase [Gallaecimonas sp. GXIMD4217]|uniref:M14 family zinc carboxypeptidase n=1 Tax=Gallaecimonas sp. GXIMD4217 TaxID=3131927 RepID=UPI00311B25FE